MSDIKDADNTEIEDNELKAEQPASLDVEEENEQDEAEPSIIPVLIMAAVIAMCFRIFVFQPFNIPSGSMFPNLLVGDYLFVSKYSYGYSKYSFPDWMNVQFEGRIAGSQPERGDIAVFRQPRRTGVDYIKRIIGLPGDTVQVTGGILYINEEAVPRTHLGLEERGESGVFDVYQKYNETLPGGVEHWIYEKSDYETYDDTEKFLVPEGFYFVMGDNRDGSLDSRATIDVGMVPDENLIGRAGMIFFSTEGVGNACPLGDGFFRYPKNLFCHFVTWAKVTRYSRIFKILH